MNTSISNKDMNNCRVTYPVYGMWFGRSRSFSRRPCAGFERPYAIHLDVPSFSFLACLIISQNSFSFHRSAKKQSSFAFPYLNSGVKKWRQILSC